MAKQVASLDALSGGRLILGIGVGYVPLEYEVLGLDFENHTSHPAPGMLLLYPGGISETEMLFPYGSTMFSSKVGQLAGNHFATLTKGHEHLKELGRRTLWEGAQDVVMEEV